MGNQLKPSIFSRKNSGRSVSLNLSWFLTDLRLKLYLSLALKTDVYMHRGIGNAEEVLGKEVTELPGPLELPW